MADKYAIFPRLAELEAAHPDAAASLTLDLIEGILKCFEIDDRHPKLALYPNKWDAVNLIKQRIDKLMEEGEVWAD